MSNLLDNFVVDFVDFQIDCFLGVNLRLISISHVVSCEGISTYLLSCAEV